MERDPEDPCSLESSKSLKSQTEERVFKNWDYTVLIAASDKKVREPG